MNRFFSIWFAAAAVAVLAACNKDEVITEEHDPLPVITFDSTDGIYTVKVGRTITVTPSVEYADGAAYAWIVDSETIGTAASHTFAYDTPQTVYVTFRVTTAAGKAEEELRIDAVDLAPPVISLALPEGGVQVLPDTDFTFRAEIANSSSDDFRCEWSRDGQTVSTQTYYTFREHEPGKYSLTLRAVNEDGEANRRIEVEVVESLPQSVRFPQQSYLNSATDRYTVAGRPLYLKPRIENFAAPTFEWSVDGKAAGTDAGTFVFTPSAEGDYRVTVKVSAEGMNAVQAEVVVHCTPGAQRRHATGTSMISQSQVFEYIPAPGQFINETRTSGFYDGITTHEAALTYASQRLADKKFVSLGGFGGYIIVGFDHSIANRGGSDYDFSIQGNAFLSNNGGSNEPGIVWVMQDTNGNGLPDDEWYELRGSETGAAGTIHDYAVTYFRPEGAKMNVQWRDSEGNEGTIDYMKAFHNQDFYYPLWFEADSYTLYGTRLAPRNSEDASGNWHNNAYEWGYADNYGSDNLTASVGAGGEGQNTGFRIANAIHPDGTPVVLEFIDFVKVQTALNTKSGALGENSTEVYSFEDMSMK